MTTLLDFNFTDHERLLIALANPTTKPDEMNEYLSPTLDWQWIYSRVYQHRLLPQLNQLLQSGVSHRCPDAIVAQTAQDAAGLLVHNKLVSIRLTQIMRVLKHQSIPAVAYKGPTLAQYLDGNTAMRTFTDLDILIPPDAATNANQALKTIGFAQQDKLDPPYHTTYIHPQINLTVELHHHITHRAWPQRYDFYQVLAEAITIPMGDTSVKMPNIETLLIFLATHGNRHLWYQLLLLTDIAKILLASDFAWEDVLQRAEAMRCTRSLVFAVYFVTQLFALPLPAPLAEQAATIPNIEAQGQRMTQIYRLEMYSQGYFKLYHQHAWWLLNDPAQRLQFIAYMGHPLRVAQWLYQIYLIDNHTIKNAIARLKRP